MCYLYWKLRVFDLRLIINFKYFLFYFKIYKVRFDAVIVFDSNSIKDNFLSYILILVLLLEGGWLEERVKWNRSTFHNISRESWYPWNTSKFRS